MLLVPENWPAWRQEKQSNICTACHNDAQQEYKKSNPAFRLYYSAKSRSKRDGLAFTIAKSDVVVPQTCPVLGIPLELRGGRRSNYEHSPSIDRLDCSQGYVPGNIRVISLRANRLKNDATPEELRAILAYMDREGLK